MKRVLAALLSVTILAWIAPVSGVYAETRLMTAGNAASESTESTEGSPEAEPGQVVVLYEDGAVDTEKPSTAREKRDGKAVPKARSFGRVMDGVESGGRQDAENTLGQQAAVLDQSIKGKYTIEDTIIFEGEDDGEMVVSVLTSEALSSEELSARLGENEQVRAAEPNYIYRAASMPNWSDPYLGDSWQLGDQGIHADAAWSENTGKGDPIVIAVMDTGINYQHEELRNRMWTEPKNFKLKSSQHHGIDLVYNDTDPMDGNGHGTHCAGIIAAEADNALGLAGVTGTDSRIELMAVRVLDEGGSGSLESIVAGYRYLIRARKLGVNIRAVNCSLGASVTSDIFDAAIEEAGKSGILTIAAAGNESSDNDVVPSSPANAKSDYVVAVAALDEDGSLASYSNYGRKNVDIAAPGSNILSAVSYDNYMPYLYDTDLLQKTTEVYGEFGGSTLTEGTNAQGETVHSVQPVSGTDYAGNAITGIDTFGPSTLFTNRVRGSQGRSILELTENDPIPVGNNTTSLRWRIENAKAGDAYILYFPYDKLAEPVDETYLNLAFRPHVAEEDGGAGTLEIGDVRIDGIDKNGKVSYSTPGSLGTGTLEMELDPTWNSIWQASGASEALLDYSLIRDLRGKTATTGSAAVSGEPEAEYGVGFVYTAEADGDCYIDISSIGISKAEREIEGGTGLFGQYDLYSGTSMATPVVTGAVALLSALQPELDASALRDTLFSTIRDGYAGSCSTGGAVDFTGYHKGASIGKPSIGTVTANFEKGEVTLTGAGYGAKPSVRIRNTISGREEDLPAADIRAQSGKIVIARADRAHHGIIGSDITFRVTNTESGESGEGTFFVTKGLKPYRDEFRFRLESADMDPDDWKQGESRSDEDEDPTEAEEMLPDDFVPTVASDLRYITGANGLYQYGKDGSIYITENDETFGNMVNPLGSDIYSVVREYAKEQADRTEDGSENYWKPDPENPDGKETYFTTEIVGNPAYLGNKIFEIVKVDFTDRDAFLLMGLDLNNESYEWTVYYDSMAEFGSAPEAMVEELKAVGSVSLAGYKGRIYMIGGGEINLDMESDEIIGKKYKSVYSCEPAKRGVTWRKEADLPAARVFGTAVVQGGNLYYVLSNESEEKVDLNIYKFDGSSWTVAGTLPKAILTREKTVGSVTIWIFSMPITIEALPTAIGIDDKGILFAGLSFDGLGDTFRFNTKTGKAEPLGYTLWGTTADRAVDGTAAGKKLYAAYADDARQLQLTKSMPITSGYVELRQTVSGEGTGIVTGGGSYTKGEKTRITITPDDGCYIYSANSENTDKVLSMKPITKDFAKKIKARKKPVKVTYAAVKDGTLDICFGRISTTILFPDIRKQAVGKRELGIMTDGTISDVRLTSSNKKYAKINKDGTVTFRKAGIGKTVRITAVAKDNKKVQGSCEIKIVSRQKTRFKWYKNKLTTKKKVLIDLPLADKTAPRKLKAKSVKKGIRLTWKKGKKADGYLIFRKTGNGRYKQIARVKAGRKSYVDRKAKRGRTYRYLITAYKKTGKGKTLRISKPVKTRKVKRTARKSS